MSQPAQAIATCPICREEIELPSPSQGATTRFECHLCGTPVALGVDGQILALVDNRVARESTLDIQSLDVDVKRQAFQGALDELPIADVLQLLHSTRKTGVLDLHCEVSSAQLVFREGKIVGCTHPSGSLPVGQVLLKAKLITEENLNAALEEQKRAGDARLRLVATLIRMGALTDVGGIEALTALVESTVEQVVGWEHGRFAFQSREIEGDLFHHVPSSIGRAVSLDTQALLMDAIRMLDEGKGTAARDTAAPEADEFDLEFDLAGPDDTHKQSPPEVSAHQQQHTDEVDESPRGSSRIKGRWILAAVGGAAIIAIAWYVLMPLEENGVEPSPQVIAREEPVPSVPPPAEPPEDPGSSKVLEESQPTTVNLSPPSKEPQTTQSSSETTVRRSTTSVKRPARVRSRRKEARSFFDSAIDKRRKK